ncbi:MAG: Cys-tRNA(Pro) deacylase [Oscillospiraceae bacterium]
MSEPKTNVMRILEKAEIPYKMHTYEAGETVDGVSAAAKIGRDVNEVFKTLVTKGKNDYFVFVIPVAEELDMKKAAKAVGEKSVEMLHVKDLNKVTGYIRGGCSPVGMKKLFKTVINETAVLLKTFIVSGGKIGFQIETAPEQLAKLINADFFDIIV